MGSLHAAWRTPVRATLLMGVIGTALAIASVYSTLAAISAGTRLLVYLACCLACLRGPRSASGVAPSARRVVEPSGARRRMIPALTAIAIVALLCALKGEEIVGGLSGIAIGTVLYFGMMLSPGARRGRAAEAVGGTTP